MNWPAYPEYKDSGVEWLGSVPSSWACTRLKRIATTIPGGTPDTENTGFWDQSDEGTPWVAIGDMSQRDDVYATRKSLTDEGLASKSLKPSPPGVILFAMYASVGEVAVLRIPAVWNQALLGVLPALAVCNNRFLFYSLLTVRDRLPSLYRSNTQNNLNAEQVGNLALALPALDEQRSIVDFLDRETGKIDALIDKQHQLIATLREDRTATITHAVTKGLNPNAEMVERCGSWSDQSPAEWTVRKLGLDVIVKTGFAFPSDSFTDAGMPIIRISDIGLDGVVRLDDAKYVPIVFRDSHRRFLVQENDIVMAMTGSIGKPGRLQPGEFALLNQRMCSMAGRAGFMSNDFLWFLICSQPFQEHLSLTAFGVAQANISDSEIVDLTTVIPNFEEQERIANYLTVECAKIDHLIVKSNQMVGSLKEYRSALITAAVTGKIDVREAV